MGKSFIKAIEEERNSILQRRCFLRRRWNSLEEGQLGVGEGSGGNAQARQRIKKSLRGCSLRE